VIVLERFANTPFGVFGTLTVEDQQWYTLEDDWRQNRRSVSCIPAGSYKLRKVLHHGTLPTYEIYPVANRSHIHIHPGTTEEHTEGCVLLGVELGAEKVAADEDDPDRRNVTKWCIWRSKEAHAQFMEAMAGQNEVPIAVCWRVPEA
jgi:hypothetical protein